MGRGRGAGSRSDRRKASERERAAAVTDYRESVGRLQHTAHRNMRQTIAYATIFVTVIATWMLFIGQVESATFPWYAAAILGGVCGSATYIARQSRPRRYVLAAAVLLAVVGVTGMFLTS